MSFSEWASGDRSLSVQWLNQTTDTILYHQVSLQNPQSLTENANQAQDAIVFYATPIVRRSPISTFLEV